MTEPSFIKCRSCNNWRVLVLKVLIEDNGGDDVRSDGVKEELGIQVGP